MVILRVAGSVTMPWDRSHCRRRHALAPRMPPKEYGPCKRTSRSIDARKSSGRTGVPSENRSPERSWKV